MPKIQFSRTSILNFFHDGKMLPDPLKGAALVGGPYLKLLSLKSSIRPRLLGTNNIHGQTSVHIFAPNGGYCLVIQLVFVADIF